MKGKKIVAAVCIVLALCLIGGTVFVFRPYYYKNQYFAPVPSNLSVAQKAHLEPIFGDYYVSPSGSDLVGDGSLERPFATLQKARDTIRSLDKTNLNHIIVAVMAGSYKLDSIEFTKADSGTDTCAVIYSAYGDGEVIINGGANYSARLTPADTGLFVVNGAHDINFSGFTVENCAGDAFRISGSSISVAACTISSVAGNGIAANGKSISISACDISHTGSSAITLTGGDRKTLSPGNCAADNNTIRNTSETDTAQPSVRLGGVGNVCTNNEIFNSPQTAVYYSGNGNIIEYNYIHNAVLASDAAAIRADMRWDYYGNFIRYNCISTLGSGANKPGGIIPCSGTQLYGNILVNIPGTAVDLMGGRDITAQNNIIVNSSCAFAYDSLSDKITEDNEIWKLLENSPRKSEIWQQSFPDCYHLSSDYSLRSDPMFAANPANSRIENNIVLSAEKSIGAVSLTADKFSRISGNAVFALTAKNVFVNAKGGDYNLAENSAAAEKTEGFENLPFDSIGRY